MRLEQWSIIGIDRPGAFLALPEHAVQCLHGTVTGHPKQPDGMRIHTSEIRGRRGELVVTASGHEYELGEPAAEYEAAFPGARKRLLASLPEAYAKVEAKP